MDRIEFDETIIDNDQSRLMLDLVLAIPKCGKRYPKLRGKHVAFTANVKKKELIDKVKLVMKDDDDFTRDVCDEVEKTLNDRERNNIATITFAEYDELMHPLNLTANPVRIAIRRYSEIVIKWWMKMQVYVPLPYFIFSLDFPGGLKQIAEEYIEYREEINSNLRAMKKHSLEAREVGSNQYFVDIEFVFDPHEKAGDFSNRVINKLDKLVNDGFTWGKEN